MGTPPHGNFGVLVDNSFSLDVRYLPAPMSRDLEVLAPVGDTPPSWGRQSSAGTGAHGLDFRTDIHRRRLFETELDPAAR